MRLDKPIGIYLLLWPTLWALWVASNGIPHWYYIVIFTIGTIIMRSAGCVINDFADRKVDGSVKRTQMRPIPAGLVTPTEALQLFSLLILTAFGLVLLLDIHTILLSVVALLLAFSYPFMKRYTHFPQVVLGAAFSWSIPMVFMAVQADLPIEMWLLYFANLAWTVAYDTYYAIVDRDDDLKIGVKSTAIAFGESDLMMIAGLKSFFIFTFVLVADILQWHWPVYTSLVISGLLFCIQLWQCRDRDREACFKAFLDNHYVGMAIFFGIFIEYSLY
jgi:4-hydroxybenzoate polyprenyltransferase